MLKEQTRKSQTVRMRIEKNTFLLTLAIAATTCRHHNVYAFMPSSIASRNIASLSSQSINIHHVSTDVSIAFNNRKQRSKLQMASKTEEAKGPSIPTSIASTTALIALDIMFRKLLKALSISFPSALAGCGTLFTSLVSLYCINPELGDKVYGLLSPGAAVLAKWLPVFFVPSLVTLPLAQSIGSTTEVLKVGVVVVAGFFFTLFSTAFSVLGVRKLFNQGNDQSTKVVEEIAVIPEPSSNQPAPKAFSDRTFNGLLTSSIVSAIAAIAAINFTNLPTVATTPLTTLAMLSTTLTSFTFGARLPKSFSKKVHPLITCTSLTWGFATLFAKLTQQSFASMLQSYKVGSMCPVHLGAGDLLLFMLGPAVVALSCQMYDRKMLMKENMKEVGTAIGVSSIGGLFGTAMMVKLLNISSPVLRLCCLSRNITSPLAMAIAGILGADVSLAVSMVVVTGLIGANFGAAILDMVGVKDAVARGLGIGAAAHGLGTAAFANEKDAFPFAAISMALTASACTVLVSIPFVKKLVLKVALG